MSWNDRGNWGASNQQQQQPAARPGFGQGYQHNAARPQRVEQTTQWGAQGDQWGSRAPAWKGQGQARGYGMDQGQPAFGREPEPQSYTINNPRKWTGTVTEIMPPNYGIVDHVAFYHNDVVAGQPPTVVGQQAEVEGIPNLDGGKYEWRLISVRVHRSMAPARSTRMPTPPPAMPSRTPNTSAASNTHTTRFGPPVNVTSSSVPGRSGFAGSAPHQPQQRAAAPMPAPASQRPMAGGGRRHGFRAEPLDDDIAAARTARPPTAPPVYPPAAPPVARAAPPSAARDRDVDRRPPARMPRDAGPSRDRDTRGRDPPRGRDREPPPPRIMPDRAPPRSGGDRAFSPARPPARPAERSGGARPPAPAGPRYSVRLPAQAVYVRERTLQYVAAQHEKMYVPSEFMRVVTLWQDLIAGPQRLTLDAPVQFEIAEAEVPVPPPPEMKPDNGAAAPPGDSEMKDAGDSGAEPVEDAGKAAAGDAADGEAAKEAPAADAVAEKAEAGAEKAEPADAVKEEEAATGGGKDDAMQDAAEENGEKSAAEETAKEAPGKRGGGGGRARASSRKSAPAALGGARKSTESASAKNWMRCTVVQLRGELSSRRLSAKGVKAELVARLAEDDAVKEAVASGADEDADEEEEGDEEEAEEEAGEGEQDEAEKAGGDVAEDAKAEEAATEAADAGGDAEMADVDAVATVAVDKNAAPSEAAEADAKAERAPSPLKRRPPPGVRAAAEAAVAEAAAAEAAVKAALETAAANAPGPNGLGTWWSAKVLLIGGVAPKLLSTPNSRTFRHHLEMPVLVRRRPKGEHMLLGGPWAPEDGAHPADDPSVLLRTAARHVRQQAGIDMTKAGMWTRLLEVQFRRADADDAVAAERGHLQRTVVFVVNAAEIAEPNTPALAELRAAEEGSKQLEDAKAELSAAQAKLGEAEAAVKKISLELAEKGAAGGAALPTLPENVNAMTVAELQAELRKHNLDTDWDPAKGKVVLVDRLTNYVKEAVQSNQEAAELVEAQTGAAAELMVAKGVAASKQEHASRAAESAAAAAKVLDNPPPPLRLTAKCADGADHLRSLPLVQLLDYTPADTKEATFELSLACEAVVELLCMHYGRVLLTALGPISKAEAMLREADKVEDEARRQDKSDKRKSLEEKKDDNGREEADDDIAAIRKAAAEGGGAADHPAPAVGSKRKADPEEDARAAAGELAKKHRADAEALLERGGSEARKDTERTESFHLACRFFDESGVGYLEEKDLEDIVHTVHPLTTRRWVRTLVESTCRRSRLRYTDLPNMQVAYDPPPPPPVGLAAPGAGESGAAEPAAAGMANVDGVTVDVGALRAAAAEVSAKLQEQSGACARAQAAHTEAEGKAAKLQAELDAAQKHNMSLREELRTTKEQKAALDARTKEMEGQVERILGAAQTLASKRS